MQLYYLDPVFIRTYFLAMYYESDMTLDRFSYKTSTILKAHDSPNDADNGDDDNTHDSRDDNTHDSRNDNAVVDIPMKVVVTMMMVLTTVLMIVITVLMMGNTHAGRSDTDNIVGGILTRVAITTVIMMMMFAIAEIP